MNIVFNLETAFIVYGLLKTEIDKIQTEQEYWNNQPELVHVAGSLDDRLAKVEDLRLEFEKRIGLEAKRLESETKTKDKEI